MAALCLDTSLQKLRPLCCCCTLHLQGDLCCSLHKGSPQALQAFVTLSACHVLQNSPQFNPLNAELNPICHLLALVGAHPIFDVSRIRGLRSALPEGQSLALMKARRFLYSHSWLSWPFGQELSPAGRPILDH